MYCVLTVVFFDIIFALTENPLTFRIFLSSLCQHFYIIIHILIFLYDGPQASKSITWQLINTKSL